jgi:hypothetical protein
MERCCLSLTVSNSFASVRFVSWSLLRGSLMSVTQENAFDLYSLDIVP